jgi:predicted TIM-barrel fold metal-dependent hydrolase
MDTAQWLDRVQEETLEPELPICDPHHHLWDHPTSRYLLDEILVDVGCGHNVVNTVFVECNSMYRADGPDEMKPVGETEFVQGISAMSASGRYGPCRIGSGIVSFADLTLGKGVRPVLEAHLAASPNRFRGIRHAAAWHTGSEIRNSHTNPPEGLMGEKAFREGFDVLAEMGLTFDAWFYFTQIDEFAELARAYPEVTIILDHFGGPLGIGPYEGRQDEVFETFKRGVQQLVELSNVNFKLGGINMTQCGFGWHKRENPPTSDELADATRHYYDLCIASFGPDRCMFESNFPVDRQSCSYNVLWNAFKKMTQNLDEPSRRALFHDTAMRVYKLETPK